MLILETKYDNTGKIIGDYITDTCAKHPLVDESEIPHQMYVDSMSNIVTGDEEDIIGFTLRQNVC